MKRSVLAILGAVALSSALAGTSGVAQAAPVKATETGHCRLVNVEAGRDLYNGSCRIKEKVDGQKVLFDIKMGSAESFLFATWDGGKTWMHGPERVRFQDRGHAAIFRWGNFRLEVEEDF
jgi:hypothetical protein